MRQGESGEWGEVGRCIRRGLTASGDVSLLLFSCRRWTPWVLRLFTLEFFLLPPQGLGSFDRRAAIRKSWLASSEVSRAGGDKVIAARFMIGHSEQGGDPTMTRLADERRHYNDIVVLSIADSTESASWERKALGVGRDGIFASVSLDTAPHARAFLSDVLFFICSYADSVLFFPFSRCRAASPDDAGGGRRQL